MDVLEHREEWLETFRTGWLAHHQRTGEADWKRYNRPNNGTGIPGSGVDLSSSRLILISSAGAYLSGSQEPFDADNLLGDYTIRTLPVSASFDTLDYAHTHYNQAAVREDPQVLLPLRHLEDLVTKGTIGQLCPSMVSFMGYQPYATRVVDETAPAVIEAAQAGRAEAALLVPA